jgi:hypothetical protein
VATTDASTATVSDELGGGAVLSYALELPTPKPFERPFAGAAVVAPKAAVRQVSPRLLELGSGSASARVNVCTTKEGLHLLTHQAGRVTTHLYLGFDYSVKPTCSAAVMRLIAAKR